jgi:hypothetical protein
MMTAIFKEPFNGMMTWDAGTAFSNDGITILNDDCQAEIGVLAQELLNNPLPIAALRPEDFEMPACTVLMSEVRDTIDDGTGVTVIDRLDIDSLGIEISTKIYWLLMSMLGRPVAQKWKGTLVCEVTDSGLPFGGGVRSSRTNGRTGFHNDNCCNLPPHFVSLLCLQPAKSGGISGIVSFESVYNILLREHDPVLPRLFQPFYFDRLDEHAPHDSQLSCKPIFEIDGGTLSVNYSPGLVELGYLKRGEEMNAETRAAFEMLRKATDSPGLCKEFEFQRGQIQVINNRRLGHCRTSFRDWDEPERKRKLVRLWIRKSGRPFYQG